MKNRIIKLDHDSIITVFESRKKKLSLYDVIFNKWKKEDRSLEDDISHLYIFKIQGEESLLCAWTLKRDFSDLMINPKYFIEYLTDNTDDLTLEESDSFFPFKKPKISVIFRKVNTKVVLGRNLIVSSTIPLHGYKIIKNYFPFYLNLEKIKDDLKLKFDQKRNIEHYYEE